MSIYDVAFIGIISNIIIILFKMIKDRFWRFNSLKEYFSHASDNKKNLNESEKREARICFNSCPDDLIIATLLIVIAFPFSLIISKILKFFEIIDSKKK